MTGQGASNAKYLEPGEALVQILRGELTIPPDHVAIAKANAALRAFPTRPRDYPGKPIHDSQRECLEGP